MVVQALIIALFVYLCGMADVWLGQPMLDRPLIISTLVGVVLGDVKTGVICGAALEMAFIGVSTIGGTNPPDALSGSAIGTAFVILNHQDIATATALAVPVASLVVMLKNLLNPVRLLINPIGMRMIENDDDKKFPLFLLLNSTIMSLPRAIVVLLGVLASNSTAIEEFMAKVPQTLIGGLSVGGSMIAAVGVAMLLKNMWSKQTVVYYFVGFLLATCLSQSLLQTALWGVALAVILFLENSIKESKVQKKGDMFDD